MPDRSTARRYEGTIELTDASLILPEGRVSLAGWTGRLEVTGETVAAAALRGQVNGGDVSLDGTVTRRGTAQASPLTITARNVFLEIPRGLRSELNADLTWRNQSGRAALSGTATITADPYTEPATAMVRMVSALTRASSDKRRALPHWLGDTTLDVTLQSNGPLTLENSVGNVEMVPDLRLTGTMSDAGLAGSIAIVDDGRIRVSGRSYRLRESAIVFTPEQGLVPRLNVFGETRIGDYDVTLRLSGPADAIETSLSSNPPLSDRDLQSLVVTGQTAGLTGETANTDAFAVGAVSGDVLGFAGQFVGLDSVRVGSSDDLELVSSDVEPSTRLTVSKRFGQRFELVLSENLDDSELTWVIIYRPRPGYEVRLSSSEGEENTLEFRQEITFGPGSSLRPAVVRVEKVPDVVAGITVSGDPGFSPSEVRDALELREGDRFDFREWSRDRDRVQRLYYDRGYYAVHVAPTRKVGDATSKRREVTLDYRILRGPRTELEVIGYPSSARLAEILKNAWNDALLPELLAQDLESATRAHLSEEGYLRPRVDVTLDNSRSGVQRALVQVTPGSRTTIRQLTFEGNRAISTSALQTLASERALAASVWNDPTPLVEEIVAEYASRGYLAATAAVGDLLLEGDRATLPVLISEGPLARVETLQVAGVSAVRQQGAQAALGLAIGSPFAEGAERAARVRLERYYRDRGYRDARVDATTRVAAQDGRVDLSFTVTEGPLYVVRGVRVEGAQSTSDSMVDRAVTITSGEAAGQSEAAETERRLYGLGTFRAAAVRFEPVPSMSSEETVAVDAVVEVQEARRYLLRYGIALSHEYEAVLDEDLRSVGVAADLRDRNFLGRGIALGLGARVERDLASVRGLFSMPRLASLPLRTNVSLTLRTENQTSSTGTLYSDDEANLTLEQRWRPRGWLELAWGYSASGRAVSFELPEPPARPISFDGIFASMNATAVLDRRNSVFDPTRGWFYSTSLQWGLRALGSDFDYLRTLIRGSYLSADRPGCARVECPMGTPPAARGHSAADRLRPLLQGRRHSDRARLQAGRAFGVRRVWHPARRNTTRRVQRGDPISCLPDCERRALRRRRQHLCRTRRLLTSRISRSGWGSASASRHPWRPSASTSATPCRDAPAWRARVGTSPSARCSEGAGRRQDWKRSPHGSSLRDRASERNGARRGLGSSGGGRGRGRSCVPRVVFADAGRGDRVSLPGSPASRMATARRWRSTTLAWRRSHDTLPECAEQLKRSRDSRHIVTVSVAQPPLSQARTGVRTRPTTGWTPNRSS